MKKIVFTIIITCVLVSTNAIAEKADCSKFEKLTKESMKCIAKNLKDKTVTIAKGSKNKIGELGAKTGLKEKLLKFKNSKSGSEFLEK